MPCLRLHGRACKNLKEKSGNDTHQMHETAAGVLLGEQQDVGSRATLSSPSVDPCPNMQFLTEYDGASNLRAET